ncbi:hypothetical protein MMC11_002894 [Xylographa trunciseda]|nr:hypothetical protein [Xylographa trunciseda]
MPIKLPKGFPRRKSSGNALEEVQNPPQPSFRVFERPEYGSKSFDGGNNLKRISVGRPLSDGHFVEEMSSGKGRPSPIPTSGNRGSGGTQKSSSSGGLYDTSSSSARFSSSSTLPSTSSIENHTDDSVHAHPKPLPSLPIPPIPAAQPGFLRQAGRTFSFGRKAAQAAQVAQAAQAAQAAREAQVAQAGQDFQQRQEMFSTPQPRVSPADVLETPHISRPRAMTETSGSTATPPKLLDADLDFGNSDDPDDFGNMFEGFGSERKRFSRSPDNLNVPEQIQNGRPNSVLAANPYLTNRSPYTPPPPLDIDRSRPIFASPFSNYSQTSQDGLMTSSPQEEQGLFDDENGFPAKTRQNYTMRKNGTSPTREHPNITLRRNSAYNSHRASTPFEDTDALLVMDSINASRGMNKPYEDGPSRVYDRASGPKESEPMKKDPVLLPSNSPKMPRKPVSQRSSQRPTTTPDFQITKDFTASKSQGKVPVVEDSLLYDASFRDLAKSADRYQSGRSTSPRKPPSKVMTPAQFERYRKEHELARTRSNASKSDASEDGDNYDDDDEERNRQLVKQRRKQEAHLSVYRQQMMKVTGEQPSVAPVSMNHRPGLDRPSLSAPNLSARMSSMSLGVDKPSVSGKSSDDEDEDIPLGILAAHGFPSKEKPPTQLGANTIRYASETYPPPPASMAGGSAAGGTPRGGLPPFARNLPKDPYYGASIVNPSNRESLAFGNSGASSVYGGSQRNIHPGGLVGVIATEERERAMRRGSPNAQGGFGLPGSGLPLPPSMAPPGMLTPGDQAQMQMSAQMNQMMQMQMQFMQQMMSMQGLPPGQIAPPGLQPGQTPPQMPFPQQMLQPGFLPPPHLQVPQIQMQRPFSLGAQSAPNSPVAPHQQQQRAMSMLSPGMASPWPAQNTRHSTAAAPPGSGNPYAPSIAPSERSNIGQPSRYRPVSIAPIDELSAKSSRASTMSGAAALNAWSATGTARPPKQPTVRAVQKPGSDDDDDGGWEEMRRRKEQKLGARRGRKREEEGMGGGLGELYYPGT